MRGPRTAGRHSSSITRATAALIAASWCVV
jgi:hypothetical protein